MSRQSILKKETIFVGLSGGVDSSVSAKRLIDQGYDVVGVFIKTWQPDFIVCNWEAERLDAMRVAAHLNIPFLTCDAEESYKNDVADYMIREYEAGRTPNPDVMCNKYVKFGTFLKFAESHGAQKVATGHYARVEELNDSYHLFRGADHNKDQSYFLWTLTQEQLSKVLFPVGDTVKPAIREEAERYQLPTFAKHDSQGICFLGQVDIKDFLSHYVTSTPGTVLDEEGTTIGTHDGALFYTIGQRHGFEVHTKNTESVPQYVVAKDIQQNTITVSTKQKNIQGKSIIISDLNILHKELPIECEAQFRYRQKPFHITISNVEGGHAMLTVLDPQIEMPSIGQSCVFYRGEECLGGGVIKEIV